MSTRHLATRRDSALGPRPSAVRAFLGELFSRSSSEVGEGLLERSFAHHFGVPGGQRRAALSLDASAALGLPANDAVRLAAAVELLHNASLVQDDLQDRSNFRRGQATVWAEFGEAAALGLENCLISTAFVAVVQTGRPGAIPDLVAALDAAITQSTRGQIADLSKSPDVPSVAEVLTSAGQKSGPLFALALILPLLAADVSASEAFDQASALARVHLTSARGTAARLPGGSGAGLADLADELLARLEHWHG